MTPSIAAEKALNEAHALFVEGDVIAADTRLAEAQFDCDARDYWLRTWGASLNTGRFVSPA